MKKKLIFIVILLSVLRGGGVTAQNIYESIGKQAELLTLSNGQFQEFFPNDTLVRIGTVLLNTRTHEIVDFIILEDTAAISAVEADVASRFLSVDPIGRQYPELTPYQFASNTPIMAIDLDGLEKKKSTKSPKPKMYSASPIPAVEVSATRLEKPDYRYEYTITPIVFQENVSESEYNEGIKKNPQKYSSYDYHNKETDEEFKLYFKDQTLNVVDYQVIDNQTNKKIDEGVYLTTDSDTDDDGGGKGGDRTKLSKTSLNWKDCKKCSTQYLDASTDPFTTAASDFMTDYKLEYGNYAVLHYNNITVGAILGDGSGKAPRRKSGENSYFVNKKLGKPSGIDGNVVLTVYFPNTGNGKNANPFPIDMDALMTHWLNFQRAKYNIDNGTAINKKAPKP